MAILKNTIYIQSKGIFGSSERKAVTAEDLKDSYCLPYYEYTVAHPWVWRMTFGTYNMGCFQLLDREEKVSVPAPSLEEQKKEAATLIAIAQNCKNIGDQNWVVQMDTSLTIPEDRITVYRKGYTIVIDKVEHEI